MKKIKIKNNENAITLIALVVTIIILLILAGVTIGFAMNETGLFEKTKEAKEKYQNAKTQEETNITMISNEINGYIDGNRGTVTLTEEQYQSLLDRITALEQNTIRYVDYNRVLDATTLTAPGRTYTAIEDCAILCNLKVLDGMTSVIYVNGKETFWLCDQRAASSAYTSINGIIYVKKGDVVTTRETYGTYNCIVYGLRSLTAE